MAKYSVPGIRFTEIDNSIRTESDPGLGIGAIVMKSNKGPVNQRIVTKNYSEFTDIFGEPETLTDYGHFAAENYFRNSTQLFAVRATMGDEQYSQIQFSYPDASVTATNKADDTVQFKFIDNQTDSKLILAQAIQKDSYETLVADSWTADEANPEGFILQQKACYAQFNNIMSETSDIVVFKSSATDGEDIIVDQGYHVTYPNYVDGNGDNPQLTTKLLLSTSAYEDGFIPASDIKIEPKTGYPSSVKKVKLSVPMSATLDKNSTNITFYGNTSAVTGWATSGVYYDDIFNGDNFYGDFDGTWDEECYKEYGYGVQEAEKVVLMDWDDTSINKTYYVNSSELDPERNTDGGAIRPAYAIKYTEYINADPSYAIIGKHDLDDVEGVEQVFVSAVSAMYTDRTKKTAWGNEEYEERSPRQVINDMMEQYGASDVSEINAFSYLKYFDVFSQSIKEFIIREDQAAFYDKVSKRPGKNVNEYLFYLYNAKNAEEVTKASVFMAETAEFITLPIQAGHTVVKDDNRTVLNSIVATPTSYLVNSVDKTYADGYTVLTQTDDEPGNGDIEGYTSVFDNQLVIASIGPGKYGDNIGVSIITTECADVLALQHQNAFNWKYSYDDEDQVDADAEGLTWKKVFRINVYVKNKNQTAEGAWGNGMDALLKDPAESWFVSTDPYAKDSEGNSLFAPTVINGHSEYIYVSRNSVNTAINGKGEYEQPNQTYSIYQLTGGKNSTKNNISEKTAALNFYKDRQRAKFDILFNCDAVDSFNGKQRYSAHQKKIAQIASARTMDIGVVQVTSKQAKTCKQMLSEGKMFTFSNGSYVAEYGGYDKYYNATLAAWIYLPKSVAGACAMAYCDTFAYPWYAPAGVARGTIAYTAGQLLRLSDDEIGQLYDQQINTTRDCGAYGVVLWGQKTALKKNSLLNRINVRRCLNYIEKNLENMMTPYLFMQNSVNTRSSARNDIDSFLQRVQAAEGIDRYSLSVTQDAEDPTIMNVNIRVVPTSAIEFIDVKIFIDRNTGVTVAEG